VKVANLAKAKDDLSRYVAYVRRGGRVRIFVRGVAAADLVPVENEESIDDEAELAELERLGILRRGAGGVSSELLRPGPRLRGKPSSVTIRQERDKGW
jgi:antitoxin (DNA-binding transcriptional repressor) of toxin-antitoxin stability system